MLRMHVHPPSPPPCIPPPGHVHPPPPQPERLVMRKDEAVGNKKKMQVCLPKHIYKLDNNLLTVEPRAVDPHCFDVDPGSAKNVHPPGKILGTPLTVPIPIKLLEKIFFRFPTTNNPDRCFKNAVIGNYLGYRFRIYFYGTVPIYSKFHLSFCLIDRKDINV
jgi:hypothetical protein